jgi:protein O-GlcNAc transferase
MNEPASLPPWLETIGNILSALVELAQGRGSEFVQLAFWEQLGAIGSVIAVCGLIFAILSAPFRAAGRAKAKRLHQKQLDEAKARADKADGERAAMNTKLDLVIERLVAREAAKAPDANAAALQQIETAATGIAREGGNEAEAALARIADGDDTGFDTLAALAAADSSAARQYTAEAEDRAKHAADTWRRIGELAFLNHTTRALAAYQEVIMLLPQDADGWNRVGLLQMRLGELDEAETAFRRVEILGVEREKVQAAALGNLGLIAQKRGDLNAAEDFHKRSLTLNEAIGRKTGTAHQLGNLGLIAQKRGDLNAAEDFYKRSLALNEAIGRKTGAANQLGNLGTIALERGDLNAAEDFQMRSLALNEAIGRKEGMARAIGNLGTIAQKRGDVNEAEDFYRRCLALHEVLGHKEGIAIQLGNLGLIAETRGQMAEACQLWRKAVMLFREVGIQHMVDKHECWMQEAGCPLP